MDLSLIYVVLHLYFPVLPSESSPLSHLQGFRVPSKIIDSLGSPDLTSVDPLRVASYSIPPTVRRYGPESSVLFLQPEEEALRPLATLLNSQGSKLVTWCRGREQKTWLMNRGPVVEGY